MSTIADQCLMGNLARGTLAAAAGIALFAAVMVYGGLVGRLKQAASVPGAGSYAVKDPFRFFNRRAHHLLTTQTRRKIEQKQENKA